METPAQRGDGTAAGCGGAALKVSGGAAFPPPGFVDQSGAAALFGIGKLKRKYLNAMMGERYLNEMIEIKRAFDPNFILGRGNMFELEN